MKKILGLVILICAFATCQDSNTSSTDQKQSLRDVGGLITTEEALRWRGRYEKASLAGRQQSAATISKVSLQQVGSSMPEYDGIYFHHALEGDKHHVLVIPFKNGQSLWTSAVAIDANSDLQIEVATASLWAERYMAENPEGPWSHSFGRNVFEKILSKEGFDTIEIVPAINDAGLPQLLLYASYTSSSTNGRTKVEVDVYDYGNVCPPNCSSN
jgi:hypothetical protein